MSDPKQTKTTRERRRDHFDDAQWLGIYDDAFDEGRAAYMAGLPITECPYGEPGTPERSGWLEGYDQ